MSEPKSRLIQILCQSGAQLKQIRIRPLGFPMVVANYAARIGGEKLNRVITNPEVLSSVLYGCYELFGYDLIMVFTDVLVEAEAMGCRIELPDDEPPVLINPAREKARLAEPAMDARMPVILSAIQKLQRLTKEQVFVLGSLKGPFSLACFLAGPERFLNLLIEAPASADSYLKLATENQIRFARAIVRAGGVPFIGDPMASGSIISPSHFVRFALPYLQELIAEIHSLGIWTGLHICGDTSRILKLMLKTNADIISVDALDMMLVRNELGPETVIMGNVSTALLETATPDTVKRVAEQCLVSAMPKLILSSACDVPPDTPQENIHALVQTAREWQWS